MQAKTDPKNPNRVIVQGACGETRTVTRAEYEASRSKPRNPRQVERNMARREQVVRKPPTVIESICEASDAELAALAERLAPFIKSGAFLKSGGKKSA